MALCCSEQNQTIWAACCRGSNEIASLLHWIAQAATIIELGKSPCWDWICVNECVLVSSVDGTVQRDARGSDDSLWFWLRMLPFWPQTPNVSNVKAQVILAVISSQNILDPEEDLLHAEMSYFHCGGVQEDSSRCIQLHWKEYAFITRNSSPKWKIFHHLLTLMWLYLPCNTKAEIMKNCACHLCCELTVNGFQNSNKDAKAPSKYHKIRRSAIFKVFWLIALCEEQTEI